MGFITTRDYILRTTKVGEIMKHHLLQEESSVLTPNGWKSVTDLINGDKALSYCPVDGVGYITIEDTMPELRRSRWLARSYYDTTYLIPHSEEFSTHNARGVWSGYGEINRQHKHFVNLLLLEGRNQVESSLLHWGYQITDLEKLRLLLYTFSTPVDNDKTVRRLQTDLDYVVKEYKGLVKSLGLSDTMLHITPTDITHKLSDFEETFGEMEYGLIKCPATVYPSEDLNVLVPHTDNRQRALSICHNLFGRNDPRQHNSPTMFEVNHDYEHRAAIIGGYPLSMKPHGNIPLYDKLKYPYQTHVMLPKMELSVVKVYVDSRRYLYTRNDSNIYLSNVRK